MTIQKSHLKDPLKGQLGGEREEGRKEGRKGGRKFHFQVRNVYVLNSSDGIVALALHPGHAANVLMSVCVPGINLHKTFLYV